MYHARRRYVGCLGASWLRCHALVWCFGAHCYEPCGTTPREARQRATAAHYVAGLCFCGVVWRGVARTQKRLALRAKAEAGAGGGAARDAAESGVAGERAAEYKRHQMTMLRQQAQDAYKLMKSRKKHASAPAAARHVHHA